MAKRMTCEEKQAQAVADRQAKDAADFRQAVEHERTLTVVQNSGDVFRLRTSAPNLAVSKAAERTLDVLYSAIYRAEETRITLERKLRWLRDACTDVQRNLERNDSYSSAPIGRKATDVDCAYVLWNAARDVARQACTAAEVYWAGIERPSEVAKRDTMLAVNVVRLPGIVPVPANEILDAGFAAGWRLMRDGRPLCLTGGRHARLLRLAGGPDGRGGHGDAACAGELPHRAGRVARVPHARPWPVAKSDGAGTVPA